MARQLQITPSAATQRLQNIEKVLGLHLVDRTARQLRFTEEGGLVCHHATQILADYENLLEHISKRHDRLIGTLKINAPFGFGRRYLAAITAAFIKLYPEINVTLTLSETPLLQAHQHFDIIVHIGHLPSSNLVFRTLTPNNRFICASPDFIERYGAPTTPQDLATLPCLILEENNEDTSLWSFKKGRVQHNIRIQNTLSSNDGDVVRQWALQGLGVFMRSQWDIAQDLQNGGLVRLLPDWQLPEAPIVALTHQRTGLPLRTKKFMDFLKKWFSPQPPWNQY